MGFIIQNSKTPNLLPVENEPLDVTNWKMIIPSIYSITSKDNCNESITGLKLYIGSSVFFVYGLTIEDLNMINETNEKFPYAFTFAMSFLECRRCRGSGLIDWLEKATYKSNVVKTYDHGIEFKRNNSTKVNVLYLHGIKVYASVPIVRDGYGVCCECHGCGVNQSNFNYSHSISFDNPKIERNNYSYNII